VSAAERAVWIAAYRLTVGVSVALAALKWLTSRKIPRKILG